MHRRSAYQGKAFVEIQPHIIKVATVTNWACSRLQLFGVTPLRDVAPQLIEQRHSEKVGAWGSLVLEAPETFDLYL